MVRHDPSIDTFGFLIHHSEMGKVVFLTDLVYSKYTFNGINNWIIEANYDDDKVKSEDGYLSSRILNSHLSINNCIKLLKSNDLTRTNNIVLIHLSDSNSDEKKFKQMVSDSTKKNVHVAEKGLSIDFDISPF